MKHLNDAALVEGLKAKEAELTEQFLEAYFEDSARFAFSITGDHSAAEDIAQDALLLALEKIDTFQDGRAFRPWFLKIVENRAREYMRGESRRKRRDLQFSKPRRAIRPPSQSLEQKEQADLIRDHLAHLDDDCRTILSLRYFESLSLRDIAESMNCPQGTVSTKIRRGLERLSRSLSPALSITPGALGILLTKMGRGSAGGGTISASRGRGQWLMAKAGMALGLLPFLVATTLLMKSPDAGESSPEFTQGVSSRDASHLLNRSRTVRPLGLTKEQSQSLSERGWVKTERALKEKGQDSTARSRLAKTAHFSMSEKNEQTHSINEIRFRVVDSEGRPLEKMSFRLERPKKSDSDFPYLPLGEVKSDADGRCQLKLDNTVVFDHKERVELNGPGVKEFIPVSKAKNGILNGGTLVIDSPTFSTVYVKVEFQGQLIEGAEVNFLFLPEGEEGNESHNWHQRSESDSRGVAVWYPGSPNESLIFRLAVAAKGYRFNSRIVRVSPGWNDILVSLEKAEPFAGYVVDPWGKAVSAAIVHVKGLFQYVETDALGRFELDYLETGKNYQLIIQSPEKSRLLPLVQTIQLPAAKREFGLKLGGEVEVRVQLPREMKYSVPMLLLLGKTTDKRRVDRWVRFRKLPVLVSKLAPGRYVLEGFPFADFSHGRSKEFEVVAGGPRQQVTVVYHRGRKIVGRLVDGRGAPVTGVYVERDASRPRYQTAGTKGFFSLPNSPCHALTVTVISQDSWVLGRFKVPPGQGRFDLGELVVTRPNSLRKKKAGKLEKSE